MNVPNIPEHTSSRNTIPVPAARIPKKPTSRRGLRGVIAHLLAAVHIVRNEMPNNAALNALADLLNQFAANLRRELKPEPHNGGTR